jgi:hypothetical protein
MSPITRPDCVTVYFNEYPGIEFPQALQDLDFEDNSWHNDAAAMARRELPGHEFCGIIVWCDYEDPVERELGGKRYSVCIEVDGSLEESVGETDDIAGVPALVATAQETLEIWIKTNGCECPKETAK